MFKLKLFFIILMICGAFIALNSTLISFVEIGETIFIISMIIVLLISLLELKSTEKSCSSIPEEYIPEKDE